MNNDALNASSTLTGVNRESLNALSKAASSPVKTNPELAKFERALENAKFGSNPQTIKTKTVNADGAITGDNEDLGVMHAPDPVGHFMLVALPKVELSSLLITPDSVTDRERAASVIGTVIAMGPDCYKDPEPPVPDWMRDAILSGKYQGGVTLIAPRPRFPSGPWTKIGETVLFSRYAGKRFKIEGIEFRMLADDEITATIPDGAQVGGL